MFYIKYFKRARGCTQTDFSKIIVNKTQKYDIIKPSLMKGFSYVLE